MCCAWGVVCGEECTRREVYDVCGPVQCGTPRGSSVYPLPSTSPPPSQGDDGHDCWVIESGEVVASIMIPGIRFAGTTEWKQTIKYSPDRTPFFGERGLLRMEPRPARMTCLTEVKALRIVDETFVTCSRIREHKENLIRGVQLFETFTDDQVGKIAAGAMALPPSLLRLTIPPVSATLPISLLPQLFLLLISPPSRC